MPDRLGEVSKVLGHSEVAVCSIFDKISINPPPSPCLSLPVGTQTPRTKIDLAPSSDRSRIFFAPKTKLEIMPEAIEKESDHFSYTEKVWSLGLKIFPFFCGGSESP